MTQVRGCKTCRGGEARRILVVSRNEDFGLLRRLPRRFDAVSVIRPDHSHAENLELQAVIARDYLECGCRQGQIAAAILLLIIAFFGLTMRPPLQDQPIENLIIAVASAIIGALLVTLSVILRARFRLLKRLDDLVRPGSSPRA